MRIGEVFRRPRSSRASAKPSRPPGSMTSSTMTSYRATAAAASAWSPVPAGPGRCHTGGVQISVAGAQGAAGTIVDTFRVANTQTSACTLYGYVGMLMLDGSGGSMPTRVVRNGGIWSTEAGPSQFLLQPGTAASFRAAWSDVPHGSE